jgi:hypothetical protein
VFFPPILSGSSRPGAPHPGAAVRLAFPAAAILCAMALAPPEARADAEPFPLPQQSTYHADWVEGLRSEDLAPSRAVVCIVDSGVAVTPDTPADSPDGPILVRTSVRPDTMPGTPPTGSGDAGIHGTLMASAAIAPRNNWGTVGLEPLGRIVSVRALDDGETVFAATDIRLAISRCRQVRSRYPRLAAIALSLGKTTPATAQDETDYDDDVASTRMLGIAVVASAGNDPAGTTQFPASSLGVVAAGAGGSSGDACTYATLDDRVDLLGPACGIHETVDVATGAAAIDDLGGSSMATTWIAQTIALLCDLSPSLTGVEAQDVLRDSARVIGGHRVLDVESAARMIGAGSVVDRAHERLAGEAGVALSASATGAPPAPTIFAPILNRPSSTPSSAGPAGHRRLVVHKIIARWRNGRLTVHVQGRERGGTLRASIYRGSGRIKIRVLRCVVRRGALVVRISQPPNLVRVQLFPAPGSDRAPSRVKSAAVATTAASGEIRAPPQPEFHPQSAT